MRSYFFLSIFAVLLALIVVPGRPVPSEAAPKSDIPAVTFEAIDYDFNGPDSIPAGLVSVQVVNKGKDLHHVQFLRLESGKTLKDFTEAAKADPSIVYGNIEWMKFHGGPNAVIPGESSSAVVNLEPGNYVVACIIPDAKGVPHVNLGMVKPLTVKGPATTGISEPKASVTITARDFTFSPDGAIKAGPQTIRFDNDGTQPHEVVVVQLPPGKSIKDFADGFAPGHSGPPPGKPIGGSTGIEKGTHTYFMVDFTPGHYGLICFFEDVAKKAPHFALGMMYEFDVR
jgi:plastocyanin